MAGRHTERRGGRASAVELVRGQNHILPRTRLETRVSAGSPVVAGATLGDEQGTVRSTEWIAHPASRRVPGPEVPRRAAADHRPAVDLDALPDAVHRVTVFLALPLGPGRPDRFGAVAAPFVAVTGLDGAEASGRYVPSARATPPGLPRCSPAKG